MAVKPLTQPLYWATDAVYSTGPFVGQPQKVVPPGSFAAEGHRPGAVYPTPAEYENSQQYNLTGLVRWLFLGSSAGAADAHVLETDSNGQTQVERARVVPANPNSYALYVQAPPGAGFAIQATGASALGDATVYTETTGPGPALEAFSASSGTAILITHSGTSDGLVVNQPGGAGDCLTINCSGTGSAMIVNGGASATAATFTGGAGQTAVVASSGTNGVAAIVAAGNGTALGIDVAGGNGASSAAAVRGTATNNDAPALYGRSSTTATNSGTGVTAEGRGSGAGLRALAAAFHAAIFQGDSSSPTHASIRIVGGNARPSTVQGGTMEYVSAEKQIVVGDVDDNAFRAVWTTGPGKVTGVDGNNVVTANNSAVWTPIATVVTTDGNAPRTSGGTVVLRFRCEARTTTAVATTLNVRIVDVTSGLPLVTRSGTGPGATAGFALLHVTTEWQRTVVLDFETTIPAAGNRTWRADVQPVGAVNIQVRDAVLTADGLY